MSRRPHATVQPETLPPPRRQTGPGGDGVGHLFSDSNEPAGKTDNRVSSWTATYASAARIHASTATDRAGGSFPKGQIPGYEPCQGQCQYSRKNRSKSERQKRMSRKATEAHGD